jgi:hypothetical protein
LVERISIPSSLELEKFIFGNIITTFLLRDQPFNFLFRGVDSCQLEAISFLPVSDQSLLCGERVTDSGIRKGKYELKSASQEYQT